MLCIDRLNAGYRMFQALFDVTMEVGAGQIVALIGANGAGKSTLLGAIAGSVPSSPLSIRLDDEPIGGRSELLQLRCGIALVPEGRRLFPSLTVNENLLLAARNGRPGPWTVARVMDELPALGDIKHRASTALSGGQQQLAAISRALVTNPRFLLCDEVSLGLSPLAVESVYALLRRVAAAGTAIVLVEQNVRRSLAFSDRYYCLQKGRVVLHGTSRDADRGRVAAAYFGV